MEASSYILIVDDNRDSRDILTKILTGAGLKTATAADGHEALQRVAEALPQLILLDLMMPRMSGFEFLSQIKEHLNGLTIPIIVISAYISEGQRAELPGVAKVLPKATFRIPQLLAAVNEVLYPAV